MINSDNLMKLQSIVKEIISDTKDAEFKNAAQPSEKMCRLLDNLVQMQSLIISIRAELVEKVFSARPDLPREITNQIKSGSDNIILFNRRKINPDRRRLNTYIADDRRVGMANRRNSGINARTGMRSN
jgi:hypothetical protein